MKKILLLLMAATLVFLCGCAQKYENAAHHFTVKFPETMSVFVPAETKEDDPALKELGIPYKNVAALAEEGTVFLGASVENGVNKEVKINVKEDENTQALWELPKEDTASIREFQEELITGLNTLGITVVEKGQFQQGKTYCIFLNAISDPNNTTFDTVYLATIYNGKQYSILYHSSAALSQEDVDECHSIFDSFYVNKTLQNPNEEPRDTTVLKAMLVVLLLVSIAFLVVFLIRLFSKKPQEEEEVEYIPQFQDQFSAPAKKEKKK